jgi:hypothetical protein
MRDRCEDYHEIRHLHQVRDPERAKHLRIAPLGVVCSTRTFTATAPSFTHPHRVQIQLGDLRVLEEPAQAHEHLFEGSHVTRWGTAAPVQQRGAAAGRRPCGATCDGTRHVTSSTLRA